MLSSEFQEYLRNIAIDDENDQLDDIAVLVPKNHHIKDVIIWVGTGAKTGMCVMLSKIKNDTRSNEWIPILYPSLEYDPQTLSDWMKAEVMSEVLEWINLNKELFDDFNTNDDCFSTSEFITRLKVNRPVPDNVNECKVMNVVDFLSRIQKVIIS